MSQFEKALMHVFGETIPKEQEDKSLKRFIELIRSAQKEVRVVAGELRSSFYNADLALVIREKIHVNPDFQISFIYSKDPDIKKGIKKTEEENKEMAAIFKAPELSKNVTVYLATRRPKYHFSTVDNWIFLEQIHEKGAPREVFIQENVKLAKEYNAIFDKMLLELDPPVVIKLNPTDFN